MMEHKHFDLQKKIQLLLLLLFLFYFSVLAFFTPEYSVQARLFPVIILMAGYLLLTLKLMCLFSAKVRKLLEPDPIQTDLGIETLENGQQAEELCQQTEQAGEDRTFVTVIQVILWLILASILFYFIGIVAGTLLSTALFFIVIGNMKWYKALLFAGILAAAVYLIFDMALGMRLHSGILF